jgi:iron complex outermembrane receptor protein
MTHRLAALAAVSLLPVIAFAQSKPAKSDDPVELSPFTVTAEQKDGYIASESVTGTRMRTPIKDLTFGVNVITSEFLEDFAFFEIGENFAYTSSLSSLDNGGGNVNMRGYGATSFLRNGFLRLGLVDRVNVDRIEVIKGPAANIYGMTTPAGMINIITKRPKARPEQSLAFALGDYSTRRVDLNVAGPAGVWGDTGYVLAAAHHEREYDTRYNRTQTQTASFGVQHKFANGGLLFVEAEWLQRETNPITNVPYAFVSTNPATNRYVGFATELKNFSQNGPDSSQDRGVKSLNLSYEARLTPTWSVRAGASGFHRKAVSFNNGNNTQFDVLLRQILGRTAAQGYINEDGGAVQADLLAHYWLRAGKLEGKTLLTVDHSQYWKDNPTYQLPTATNNNTAFYSRNLSVDAPDYRVPLYSSGLYTNLSRRLKTRVDVNGGFLRQQFAAMDGKLIAVAGTRFDSVVFRFSDIRNNTYTRFTDRQLSPMVGANYKLTPKLALYFNRSNSFSPNAQRGSAGIPASETAQGWDYGVKAGFFDDRLQFTAGGFYIIREGVTVTEIDAAGNQVDVPAGTQRARGAELDFTWRVTDELTLLGGYGYVDARIIENGRDRDSVGRRPARIPVDNAGLALKYKLSHGLSANAGITYTGKSFADSTAGGITEGASSPNRGLILSHDGRRDIRIPGYSTFDVGLSYRFRSDESSKLQHMLRFNLKNVFDREYIDIRKNYADRRGFYVSYSVTH